MSDDWIDKIECPECLEIARRWRIRLRSLGVMGARAAAELHGASLIDVGRCSDCEQNSLVAWTAYAMALYEHGQQRLREGIDPAQVEAELTADIELHAEMLTSTWSPPSS